MKSFLFGKILLKALIRNSYAYNLDLVERENNATTGSLTPFWILMVVVHHTSYSNSLFSSVVNYLTRIRNSPQYIFLLNCSIRSCRFWAILATLFLHHTLYDVFTRESSSLCVLRDCLAWIQARNTYIRRRNTVCKCIHLLCQTKANSIVKQLVCGGYCWHEKIWWQSFFFLVIANTLQFCSTFDEDKYIFFNKSKPCCTTTADPSSRFFLHKSKYSFTATTV